MWSFGKRLGAAALLAVLGSQADAAIIRLENAADGSSEMTLAPGESGVMNIVLEISPVDTCDVGYATAFLNDDADCIDVTAGDCTQVPFSTCDRAGDFPFEISDDGGHEYGLIWGVLTESAEIGPGTYVLDALTLTHTGPEVEEEVLVTFELGARQPQAAGFDLTCPYVLAPFNFPPDFPNFLYVGDDNSTNPPFTIHKVKKIDSFTWNRRVAAVAITEFSSSLWTVSAVVSLEVEGEDVDPDADFSTLVEILNGSTVVYSQLVDVYPSADGCGINCATTQQCICCDAGCFCGAHQFTIDTSGGIQIDPDDKIQVRLSAPTGALPETDTLDDISTVIFEGDPYFWNRALRSAEVVPNEDDPSKQDVLVQLGLDGNYEGDLNLATDIEVLVNGVSQAYYPAAIDDVLTWDLCANLCGSKCITDQNGAVIGDCSGTDCGCKEIEDGPIDDITITLPDLPRPGDLITIVIFPAADRADVIPELSGYNETDTLNFTYGLACEGDANGDGVVDPLDSGYVQARFGCKVGEGDPACDAADVNDDKMVDPLDVGYVLARFGECS